MIAKIQIRKMHLISGAIALFSLVLFPDFAAAQSRYGVVMSSLDVPGEKSVDLLPGQTADVEVYLKSFGEPLANFRVAILRAPDQKVMEAGVSDDSGYVIFRGLIPGRYHLAVQKTKQQKEFTSVGIGDYFLYPSGKAGRTK